VSAANATDPETITMTACASAVTPRATRLILTARMPIALDSSQHPEHLDDQPHPVVVDAILPHYLHLYVDSR
jgi:hypothetical protein